MFSNGLRNMVIEVDISPYLYECVSGGVMGSRHGKNLISGGMVLRWPYEMGLL
jgi:hypothetical protein